MVWAYDRVHSRLVRIEVGMADELRPRARVGELVCPVDGCPTPRLTTRRSYRTSRGTLVPDGFKHVSAPNPAHAPESVHHINGKLLVADWLRRAGWDDVELERRDTQSGRVPDVTACRAGNRLAVEVQFAPLSAHMWAQRTTDLERDGFEVVWLWGASSSAGTRSLNAAQTESLRRGRPVLWVCPDDNLIGTTAVRRHVGRARIGRDGYLVTAPTVGDRTATPKWAHPSAVRIVGRNVWHPDTDQLVRALAFVRSLRLHDLRQGLQNLHSRRFYDEQRLLVAQQPAGGFTVNVVPERPFRPPQSSGAPVRETGPDDVRLQRLEAAGLEALVAKSDSYDEHVYGNTAWWHGLVTAKLLDRAVGKKVRLGEIGSYVEQVTNCETGMGRRAVTGLLRRLEEAGFVTVARSSVTVLRPLPPAANEAEQLQLFE